MLISQLLAAHTKELAQFSISDNLGDAFLLNHNRVYSIVRRHCLQLGYEFSNEFSANYYALSLSQLDVLLARRKIPYYNNVSVLFEIEHLIPKATNWIDIQDNFRGNFLFHESCHAVARSLAEKHFSGSRSDLRSTDHKILKVMIEESFANACELLGIGEADVTPHRIFYELNSYIFKIDNRIHLKRLIDDFGLKFCISFFTLAYLYSNFLYERIDERELEQILGMLLEKDEFRIVRASSEKMKVFRSLFKISFDLNPQFRKITSGFFLKLSRISLNPRKDMTFDFIGLIQNEVAFQSWLAELTDLFAESSK